MSAILSLAAGLALLQVPAPATGSERCAGPRPGWRTLRDGLPHMAVLNRLRIRSGNRLEWNGVPVTRDTVRGYFSLIRTMRPLPFTILVPEADADCAFLEAIRDDMAATLPCDEDGCGEGRGRWGDGDGRLSRVPGSQAERELAKAIAAAEAAADAAVEAADEAMRPKRR